MMAELNDILEKDIMESKRQLENDLVEEVYTFLNKIEGKYDGIIDNFRNGLSANYDEDCYTLNIKFVKANLTLLKEKMEMFLAMGCKNLYKKDNLSRDNVPNVLINNSNSNSNVIDINISFDEAREAIEKMTALPDSEVDEILNKISELEKIVQSSDRKTKKWENAKGIIKWIADKGVDVGIALLPLLLQIK